MVLFTSDEEKSMGK